MRRRLQAQPELAEQIFNNTAYQDAHEAVEQMTVDMLCDLDFTDVDGTRELVGVLRANRVFRNTLETMLRHGESEAADNLARKSVT
jgi:hypothetical protein